jgi:hypothetical protein
VMAAHLDQGDRGRQCATDGGFDEHCQHDH